MTSLVVVGGGIAGLAAAWEAARRPDRPHVTVLERDDRLGGKILTTDVAGRPVDAAGDAFLARSPWARGLCAELGLADELVAPAVGQAAVVARDGRARTLPDGLVLGVPTGLGAVARSGLLSPGGLVRAGLEPLVPGRASPHGRGDSVGGTIRHRFGAQVHEALVDPLLGSINATDSTELSLAAGVPQLADAAGRSRSLLLGLRAARRARPAPAPGGAPAPVFLTHPRGLGHVVATLVAALVDAGVDVRTGVAAEALRPQPGGGWVVDTADGRVEADAVVLASPARASAALLRDAAPAAADALDGFTTASVAMITVSLAATAVARVPAGSGLLVPGAMFGDRLLTAVSVASNKWPHWAAPGQVLLRASAGRLGDRRAVELSDDDLVAGALAELDGYFGLRGQPDEVRLTRWPDSFPQYRPGHGARVAGIEAALAEQAPGVALAGAAFRGIGIPACIEQGRRAATVALAATGATAEAA